jgi:hypothetical protein
VEIAHYPVKTFDGLPELDLNLEHDFNYLAVAQWGPRKNVQNLVRWFVEENHDEEVGLIVKMSLKNNSVVDREFALQQIENSIPDIPDRKCKVYLLHGDMSESEMHALYRHHKVKAMVSLKPPIAVFLLLPLAGLVSATSFTCHGSPSQRRIKTRRRRCLPRLIILLDLSLMLLYGRVSLKRECLGVTQPRALSSFACAKSERTTTSGWQRPWSFGTGSVKSLLGTINISF